MEKQNVSVIIPTLSRTEDLKRLLDSIFKQTVLPYEIVIVDQSTDSQTNRMFHDFKDRYSNKKISFCYIYQEEKNSAKARNIGISNATGDIISFLDDDVILHKDYFEKVIDYLRNNAQVGGVSGNILEIRKISGWKWGLRKALMRFFLINKFDGKMTKSGFGYPVYDRDIDVPLQVEMLAGCNMNFRTDLIKGIFFDNWFTGYSYREDVDFSYLVSRKTKLYILPEAKLTHNLSKNSRIDEISLKRMQLGNYYYIFKKHKYKNIFSSLFFFYSMLGYLLIDLLNFLVSFKLMDFKEFVVTLLAAFQFIRVEFHPKKFCRR